MYQYDIWRMSLYVGDRLVCRHTCIPDGRLRTVTYARCRIDTIDSPDDEHMIARNNVEYRNKHIRERMLRQVGYLQELLFLLSEMIYFFIFISFVLPLHLFFPVIFFNSSFFVISSNA